MKPFSNDLRLRIIENIQANELSQAEIAEQFGVSKSFVEKLWHRFRTTESYQAKAHAGGVQRFLKNDEPLIRELVAAQPDATLAELCEKVAARTGSPLVTTATDVRRVAKIKLAAQKKSLHVSERETERVKTRRVEYRAEVAEIDLSRLKFLDEAGSNLAMTRLYGRAAKGARVIDSVPQN